MDWAETKHFIPGIVSVLHTFGSQLNFNSHIHILYTLGGVDTRTFKWRSEEFIPYQALKSRFKTILLACLRDEFKNGNVIVPEYVEKEWLGKFGTNVFGEIQNQLWDKDWYLHIGEKLDNVDLTVGYVGRYAKRPAMAETRIKYYSKNEDIVKFEYRDKTTGENKIASMSVENFIGLLVRHIPPKHFHMIRYYGAYANARKNKIFKIICDQLNALFGIANLIFEKPGKTWRERIRELTGEDPLRCSNCGMKMRLTEICYRIRDGTMKHIYFFSRA